MFCTKCGAQNEANAGKCAKCGLSLQEAAQQAGAQKVNIPNYLVQAILCTLLCCIPFGIVAIIFAAQVNTKLVAGDIEGAKSASRKAKLWSWVSFGVGLAFGLIWLILNILAAVSGKVPIR